MNQAPRELADVDVEEMKSTSPPESAAANEQQKKKLLDEYVQLAKSENDRTFSEGVSNRDVAPVYIREEERWEVWGYIRNSSQEKAFTLVASFKCDSEKSQIFAYSFNEQMKILKPEELRGTSLDDALNDRESILNVLLGTYRNLQLYLKGDKFKTLGEFIDEYQRVFSLKSVEQENPAPVSSLSASASQSLDSSPSLSSDVPVLSKEEKKDAPLDKDEFWSLYIHPKEGPDNVQSEQQWAWIRASSTGDSLTLSIQPVEAGKQPDKYAFDRNTLRIKIPREYAHQTIVERIQEKFKSSSPPLLCLAADQNGQHQLISFAEFNARYQVVFPTAESVEVIQPASLPAVPHEKPQDAKSVEAIQQALSVDPPEQQKDGGELQPGANITTMEAFWDSYAHQPDGGKVDIKRGTESDAVEQWCVAQVERRNLSEKGYHGFMMDTGKQEKLGILILVKRDGAGCKTTKIRFSKDTSVTEFGIASQYTGEKDREGHYKYDYRNRHMGYVFSNVKLANGPIDAENVLLYAVDEAIEPMSLSKFMTLERPPVAAINPPATSEGQGSSVKKSALPEKKKEVSFFSRRKKEGPVASSGQTPATKSASKKVSDFFSFGKKKPAAPSGQALATELSTVASSNKSTTSPTSQPGGGGGNTTSS